jgi:hypothetical protein
MKNILIVIFLGLGFFASCQEGRIDPNETIDWRDFQKDIWADSVLSYFDLAIDSVMMDSLAIHRTAIDINTALNVQSAFEILWLQDSIDVHRIRLDALLDSIAVLRALH